ncbi:MAG: bifunctional riboflavin kinase/FAD synthetase [Terriglobia bacterium]
MEVFHSLDQLAERQGRSVVTIGAFDGIHLAHQELLRRVRERAAQENAASVAITFDPHPLRVLAPQKAPKLLTPPPVRLELIEASGVDRLLVLPFNRDFSLWPPEKFVEEVLVKALGAAAVVVGDNFRFGYRAAGTPAMLEELGKRWQFETQVLPSMYVRGMPVSSSQIRALLEERNISAANRLLGHPFSVRNAIEPGLGIGRSQTVPTLNLAPYSEMLPATGVYVTQAKLGLRAEEREKSVRPLRSVTNVGYRPTFGERALGVETHLLEPWDGPAPATLEVSFLYRLRDECKFDSPEQLKAQILKDIWRAESYFRRLE